MGYGGVLVKGGKPSLSISRVVGDGSRLFFFGMISGSRMFLLKFFILSYFCIQPIRRLVFLKC